MVKTHFAISSVLLKGLRMKINTNKELNTLITGTNSGKKIPALKLIEDSPTVAAVLSKLNTPNNNGTIKYDQRGNRTIATPNATGLSDVSNDIIQKSNDNENTLQLFPELEQALRILINAVLAPKDLNSTEINFTLPPDLKVSPLSGFLLPLIKSKLSKDFKLKEMIPEMLYKTLGIDGSYPIIVIPESSVDDMINDRVSISTESIASNFGTGVGNNSHLSLGFLGDSDFNKNKDTDKEKTLNVGFESFSNLTATKNTNIDDNRLMFKYKDTDVNTLIRVTDNVDILKFPELVKIKREQEVNKNIEKRFRGSSFHGTKAAISLESNINNPNGSVYGSTDFNDIQLTQLLYKKDISMRNVTRKVKTSNETERLNVGAPLVKILTPEAVIPVCMSGDRNKHVAFFVLLDGMGNPLSKDSASSVYDDFRRNQISNKGGGGNNLSSHLLQRTADAFSNTCEAVTYQQMQKICGDIIETDLLARLRNGIYGEDVALVENTIVYDIMLSRMFKEQQTQVLFVPAELMTYFHFKLRKNGTGKTILEDSMVLNSLRAVLMFANVNRAVINSVGRTEIELNVDENDPNKAKTLEIAKHEALKTRQSQALPATISPTDIQHYLSTSQMHFNIGAVNGLPGTSVKFNEVQTSYAQPDSTLTEQLDKKAIMALGVPPELVSNTNDVEFATNIISNNLRLNKQIIQIQDVFQPQLSSFVRTFSLNHGGIVKEVEKIITDNLKTITEITNPDKFFSDFENNQTLLIRLLAREFLSNIDITFSRPDTVTLKNQMDAFNEFEAALDKVLKYRLSEDILSEATSGTITSEQIGLVFNSVKAHHVREWLKKNAIMPELFDIVDDNKDTINNNDIFDKTSVYAGKLTVALNKFLKKILPVGEASQRDMEALTSGQEIGAGPSADTSGSGGGSDSNSDSDSDNSEDEGDDSGGDDLGMPSMPGMDNF